MLNREQLEDLLHRPGISNQDRLLCCLAVDGVQVRPLAEVRDLAVSSGWRSARTTNLSRYLGRAKGLAISTPQGWKLTTPGRTHVARLAGVAVAPVATAATSALRAHVAKIKDVDTKAFVEEAVSCLEHKLLRSAVVLSWVGAVSVLYNQILQKKLTEFNAEATKRHAKWKTATTVDDLARMEEHEFLQVASAVSLFGKSVKTELEGCLKFRNGCGHPNSLKIAENRVAAHIETLVQNVFEPFAVS